MSRVLFIMSLPKYVSIGIPKIPVHAIQCFQQQDVLCMKWQQFCFEKHLCDVIYDSPMHRLGRGRGIEQPVNVGLHSI